jgi:hypothetical protein
MKWLKRNFGSFTLIAVLVIGTKYMQDIQDWSKLLRYQPPPPIARLATTTTMTDTARRLFYVNQPQIETRKSAQNLCKSSEHTVVLGCYVLGQGIFIQSVPDPRLEGVMEVTAAHEMLHVAYQRLSSVEQGKIDRQLQLAFVKLQNPRIKDLIGTYNEQDPSVVNTELHSILGTEVRNLNPELEAHYHNYFTDRSKIVTLSERYEGVFTSLRERAQTLKQQLATRKVSMTQVSQQIEQEAISIDSESSYLKNSIAANPQSDYASRVSSFNDRVRNYNQLINDLRQQTDTYNQLVNEHNSLALEEKSLVESLQNQPLPQQ